MLCRLGTLVIEPSGDDGAESIDEKRSFIVAGRVIGLVFEMGSELLGIGFYIVEHPNEASSLLQFGVTVVLSESISTIAFLISIFIFTPHFISSSVRRIISGASFLRFALTIAL